MMMTQSYYGGAGNFDAFQRGGQRGLSNASAYYERVGPYDYYHEPRHGLRGEYGGRHQAHTLIQEQESMESVGGQSRRRIAVACGRCRRRKIKCSGDPGDGTGCQACRQSGANVNDCTFIRVGSHEVAPPTMSMLPPSSTSTTQPLPYTLDAPPPTAYSHHAMHRPSLPTLHTRGYASDYETYDTSPTEAYTYASPHAIARQDSFAIPYSSDSLTSTARSYSASAPAPSSFYEQPASYSFGSLHSPLPPRLPSVTSESMSSLNMGHLHSSLPVHPAPERRLPVPYTISYPQSGYPLPALENATAGFRPHIHGVHSRTAMPWSSDGSASSRSNSLALHQTAAAPQVSTSYDPGHTGSRTQLLTEPCIPSSSSAGGSGNGNGNNLGYIFPPYTSETSPTSAASQSNVYTPVSGVTSLMMPPTTSGLRYRGSASNLSGPADDTTSTGGGVGGNNPQTPRTGNGASSAHHREAAASLYSFSTETSDRAGSVAPSEVPTSTGGTAVSRGEGVEGGWSGRPQHAASSEGLRRLSGIEGRGGSGNGLGSMGVGVGHRSSARSLNGRH